MAGIGGANHRRSPATRSPATESSDSKTSPSRCRAPSTTNRADNAGRRCAPTTSVEARSRVPSRYARRSHWSHTSTPDSSPTPTGKPDAPPSSSAALDHQQSIRPTEAHLAADFVREAEQRRAVGSARRNQRGFGLQAFREQQDFGPAGAQLFVFVCNDRNAARCRPTRPTRHRVRPSLAPRTDTRAL